MRRTLASWAALLGVVAFVCLPLSALAQRRGGVPFGLNWNRGRTGATALLSMALTGDCEGTTPAGLTFSRTSTATCTRADGTLVTLAANTPRLEAQGLLVEGAATNLLLQSEALSTSAPWAINSGTPTIAPNAWDFGFGLTGETLTDDNAASAESINQNVSFTAPGAYTLSCYARAGTSSTLKFFIIPTGGGTGVLGCQQSLTGARQRVSCTTTLGGTLTGATLVVQATSDTATDTGSVDVGGCQFESGPVATSYIPTQGTQVTRTAEVPSVAMPLLGAQADWAFAATFKPEGPWAGGVERYAFGYRTPDTANSFHAWLVTGGGPPFFGAYDADGTFRNANSTITPVNGTHRMRYAREGGDVQMSVDGANVVSTRAGTGSALPAWAPGPLYIGVKSTGAGQANGWLSNICVSATPGACQ